MLFGRRSGGTPLLVTRGPILSPQRTLVAGNPVEILVFFEEVRDVQERVPLQPYIDKCRLHPGQDTRDAPLMDTARQRILVGALEINFHQLIVFNQRYLGLVPIGRNHQFLAHRSSLSRGRICAATAGTRHSV